MPKISSQNWLKLRVKNINEMELQIRRILRYNTINVDGLHNSEQFIEEIKEVMLSDDDTLEKNIAKADFLFSLSKLTSSSILKSDDHNYLILHMKKALHIFPELWKHIEAHSTLFDVLISDQENMGLDGFDLQKFGVHVQRQTIAVPIIGTVKAGPNGISFEEPIGFKQISADDLPVGIPSYCLQVRGDSMAPYLLPDDFLVFHEDPDIANGSLAVVIINDEEGTVKWLKRRDGCIRLETENPYYPPREFCDMQLLDVRIVGPVTQIMRKPSKKNGGIFRP